VQDITSNTQGMTDLQTVIWIKFVKSLAGAEERDIMNLVVKSLQECSKEIVGELSTAKEEAPHDIAKVLEHRLQSLYHSAAPKAKSGTSGGIFYTHSFRHQPEAAETGYKPSVKIYVPRNHPL
jgi:hypothetical protein